MNMVNLKLYRDYFNNVNKIMLSKNTEINDTGSDALYQRNLKRKMKVVRSEFMKQQNRSKLINVNPIFNKKEYLGINTEPLPVERYLIEMNYP